jgi:oxamate amidohydrolase
VRIPDSPVMRMAANEAPIVGTRTRRTRTGGLLPDSRRGRGSEFALATPHAIATDAGLAAFDAGGTCVDAAIAAAATLAVVSPHECALGGDVIALIAGADGVVQVVNGSGAAAEAVDVDALRAAGEAMALTGPATITVPGAVAAWATLTELGGRLPLARLLEHAIRCASEGFPVTTGLATYLAGLAPLLVADEGMQSVFFRGARPLVEGEMLRQPALATSLEELAADGPQALYGGTLGRRLVEGLRRLGSPLDVADIEAHTSEVTAPIAGQYRGFEVLTSPPNSQGFLLLEILAALQRLELDDPLGVGAPVLVELFRETGADRERWLADPRRADVPLDRLLGAEHLAELCECALAPVREPTPSTARPAGDTTAVVAADAEGRAVSLIQSIFHAFGSGILEPETGIVCQNRGAQFSLDPASPNVIAGGKRPAHTLMPVVVRRHGRLVAVVGTMGGKVQPQISAQILLRMLDGREDLAAVVADARWVLGGQTMGSAVEHVFYESRTPPQVCAALASAGIETVDLGAWSDEVGHAQVILVEAGGVLDAASDPRADGSVAVR